VKEINGRYVRDMLREIIEPSHTALLVVDIQNDFCHPDGQFAKSKNIEAITAMVPNWVEFVNAAQDMGIFTVFIRQLTLPHGRSDSPAWLRFKCRDGKNPEYTLLGSWGAEIVEGLTPRERDVVVPKFRPDAFVRTPLDSILRTQGIESVVIIGTTTEGCVESTVRGASYHDYYVVPVGDLISGPNPQLHENSLTFMRARYPVAEAREILQAWKESKPLVNG
jgi:ureidoacrylate peracid hydrolase